MALYVVLQNNPKKVHPGARMRDVRRVITHAPHFSFQIPIILHHHHVVKSTVVEVFCDVES